MVETYYEKLGVSPQATPEEIEEAYQKLASQKETRDILLEKVYETLSDSAERKAYDQRLAKIEEEKPTVGERTKRFLQKYFHQQSGNKVVKVLKFTVRLIFFPFLLFFLLLQGISSLLSSVGHILLLVASVLLLLYMGYRTYMNQGWSSESTTLLIGTGICFLSAYLILALPYIFAGIVGILQDVVFDIDSLPQDD